MIYLYNYHICSLQDELCWEIITKTKYRINIPHFLALYILTPNNYHQVIIILYHSKNFSSIDLNTHFKLLILNIL